MPWDTVGVNESSELALLLRPGELADAHEVALFHTKCWREAYRGIVSQAYLDGVTVADREIRWQDRLTSGVRRTVLALSSERLVGVVSWGRTDVPDLPPLELMSLYVAASLRSQGVADELVAHSICSEPAHLLVFEANRRAQAFTVDTGLRQTVTKKLIATRGSWN